jgi:hypothetical protein
MTTLKIVVITLAVLIVALLVAIAWRIVTLAGGGGGSSRGFSETKLGPPAGCRVVEASAGDGRLVLRIGGDGACERVLLLDPASGRVLGVIFP